MKITRNIWSHASGWETTAKPQLEADLVMVFGSTQALRGDGLDKLRSMYPGAYICGCSTAGEIAGERVLDDSMVATAVQFEGSHIETAEVTISGPQDSYAAGLRLVAMIPRQDLVHVFVLSDGLAVNGTELVRGINSGLPPGVAVTGGLAGDGARFVETVVCSNGVSEKNRILMLGFYGSRLRVGYGSMGGWDAFGPERRITRSKGNVLYELDGQSALGLYKKYLGEHAAALPASGLLFPLAIRDAESEESVVRTILAVNEQDQSMTFAGDMREGALAKLMRANFDRLVEGASGAARACRQSVETDQSELAILISCVGRKLLLNQRIEEEVEGVLDVLGKKTMTTGFYSYGEISPLTPEARCTLHNQTMTITTFAEV